MDVRPRIAILAVPESSTSTLHGMYDLFVSAGRDWGIIVDGRMGDPVLDPRIVAVDDIPFPAANGIVVHPHLALADCGDADVVCVPDLLVPPGEPLDGRYAREVEWLSSQYSRGATIATACSGTLLLAEAGLLDGLDATTHWAYCDVMRRRYPRVRVHAKRSLVVAGDAQRLVMAGGGTSWLDLALYLIARLAGVEAAMQTARLHLIDWHRVGQQPFARLASSRQVDDAVVARCQSWIAENYPASAPVAGMVRLSGLAERSFKRRFQEATGMGPLEYVHTLRLEEAKHLLETGTDAIEAVAAAVGYEDAGFFSRLFRRQVGLTPSQYRRRFGSLRAAVQGADTGAGRLPAV